MTINLSDRFGYEPKLPDDIREIFMWLCQDVVHIQCAWNFYLELFTSENYAEVADLVNGSFLVIEEAVRADLTMSICRISDPAQTLNKDNLTFATLAQRCKVVIGLETLVDDFMKACEPIRKLRHKKIGHNDLNTRIDPLNNPLPGVGQKEINEILRLAILILNTVIQHYSDTELFFLPIQTGGAKDLLFWLKSGKKFQEERNRRFLLPKAK